LNLKIQVVAKAGNGIEYRWCGTITNVPSDSIFRKLVNLAQSVIAPDCGDAHVRRIIVSVPRPRTRRKS
jgi:hypothetical protein